MIGVIGGSGVYQIDGLEGASGDADVTGMTEARLAREAEFWYAPVVMITDYDSWHDGHGALDVAAVMQVVRANAAAGRDLISRLPRTPGADRAPCPYGCGRTLTGALMTAQEMRDPQVRASPRHTP